LARLTEERVERIKALAAELAEELRAVGADYAPVSAPINEVDAGGIVDLQYRTVQALAGSTDAQLQADEPKQTAWGGVLQRVYVEIGGITCYTFSPPREVAAVLENRKAPAATTTGTR